MNILMISDVYYPRINGVSTSIATFRNALHALGHQTVLVAPDYPGHSECDESIVRVPSLYLPFDPEDRIMRTRPLHQGIRALTSQRFDLVHIHTPFVAHRAGIRLARRLGIPAVETYHTFFEEYFHHYLPVLPRSWTRLAARAVSRRLERGLSGLIVPSQAIEQALRRYGLRAPIRIIPTGLDLDEFTAGDGQRFCRAYGLDPDRPTLVYVGRVAHEKNIGFLLEVLDQVRRTVPDVLLVTEEQSASHSARADTFLIVDPLDGTKEFVQRRGDFTVNIAYVENGVPLRGVVYAPAKGRMFFTRADGRSVEETGDFDKAKVGKTRAIFVSDVDNSALMVVASKSHRDKSTDDYIAKYAVRDMTSAGSSLKFCLVATGEADLYPRLGRTMEWDTAAGHAVLSGAGGQVVRFDDHTPLTYGKDDFANPFFIATAPGVELKAS